MEENSKKSSHLKGYRKAHILNLQFLQVFTYKTEQILGYNVSKNYDFATPFYKYNPST